MSIRLQTRVWELVPLKGTELLLLLTIADHANEQGICWPRQERLAERVRCSVRQTRRLLRDLETCGYLFVDDGRGRGKTATIQLNLELLASLQAAVTGVRFSTAERAQSGVPDEGTFSATLQERDDAENRTSSAKGVAKSGASDNRTSSAKGVAQSGISDNRTSSVTLQGSNETENRTSSAREEAKSEISDDRTSSATLQESEETDYRTFSVTERVQSSPERVRLRVEAKQAETENRTSSALQRSPVTAKRTPSAPKPDIAPHACVEPLKNRNNNQQQIQKSVLCAAPNALDGISEQPETLTDRDDNSFLHSRQKTEEHSSPPSESGEVNAASPMPERVQFSRERVRLLAQARDAHPKSEIVPESLHALLFGADFAASSQESTAIDLPGAAEANVPTGTASEDSNARATPSDTQSQSAPTPAPRTPDPLQDALSASLAGIKQKIAEARAAADERAAAEASMPKEEPAPTETPQQRYFNILAWMVGADYATLSKEEKGQVAQTMGILQKAGYTEADLRTFWHSVWKKDWRWLQKGTHPTLKQVRAEIGKIRVEKQTEALALHPNTGRDANGKPILTPEELEMQRLMREAKERGRVARETAQNQGLRVPDLQGHEVGLSGLSTGTPGLRESLPLRVPTGD